MAAAARTNQLGERSASTVLTCPPGRPRRSIVAVPRTVLRPAVQPVGDREGQVDRRGVVPGLHRDDRLAGDPGARPPARPASARPAAGRDGLRSSARSPRSVPWRKSKVYRTRCQVNLTSRRGRYRGRSAALLLRHRVHRGRHHHRPRLHRRRRRDRPRVLRGEHPVRPGQGDPVGAAQRARPAAARRRTRPGAAASGSARTCSPSSPGRARRSSCGPGSGPTTTSRCASCGARCLRCRGRSRGSPASCASAGTTPAQPAP